MIDFGFIVIGLILPFFTIGIIRFTPTLCAYPSLLAGSFVRCAFANCICFVFRYFADLELPKTTDYYSLRFSLFG